MNRPRPCGPLCRLKPAFQAGGVIPARVPSRRCGPLGRVPTGGRPCCWHKLLIVGLITPGQTESLSVPLPLPDLVGTIEPQGEPWGSRVAARFRPLPLFG